MWQSHEETARVNNFFWDTFAGCQTEQQWKSVGAVREVESRRSFSSLIFSKLRHLARSTVLHRGKGDQQGREWLKDWCHCVIPAHFRKRRMFIFHSSAISIGNRALLSVFRYALVYSGRSDATMHNILLTLVCHHFFFVVSLSFCSFFYYYLTDFTFLIHKKILGLFTRRNRIHAELEHLFCWISIRIHRHTVTLDLGDKEQKCAMLII